MFVRLPAGTLFILKTESSKDKAELQSSPNMLPEHSKQGPNELLVCISFSYNLGDGCFGRDPAFHLSVVPVYIVMLEVNRFQAFRCQRMWKKVAVTQYKRQKNALHQLGPGHRKGQARQTAPFIHTDYTNTLAVACSALRLCTALIFTFPSATIQRAQRNRMPFRWLHKKPCDLLRAWCRSSKCP